MENIRQVNVIVDAESKSATKMTLKSGKFEMTIDEPKALGGTDEGPSPIQVLLMSLAGCLNVTGHEVAKQRGLKLNSMRIKIEGNLNPCTFIGCSYEERAGFQKVIVTVNPDFQGATEEEIENWLSETEERCPVTDNLENETQLILEKK